MVQEVFVNFDDEHLDVGVIDYDNGTNWAWDDAEEQEIRKDHADMEEEIKSMKQVW